MGRPNTFSPGHLLATPGVLREAGSAEIMYALARHFACDWGDVCEQDKRMNDAALKSGDRLVSAYHTEDEQKFWIITEADRSATTVLLPDEY